MARDNRSILNRVNVLLDALSLVISFSLAYVWRFMIWDGTVSPLSAQSYFLSLLWIVPMYLMLFSLFSLYASGKIRVRRSVISILLANTVGFFLITLILYFTKEVHYSRNLLLVFGTLNFVFMLIDRFLLQKLSIYLIHHGAHKIPVLMVGYSETMKALADRILQNPQWRYEVLGIIEDEKPDQNSYRRIPFVGKTEDIVFLIEKYQPEEVIITLSLSEYKKLRSIVDACEKCGVHTKFAPDYVGILPTRPYTEDLQGIPVIHIRHVPLTEWRNRFMKRSMDLVFGSIALLLFSPLMLVISLLIKLTSKGPLIYKQERVGLHNKPFKMYKFRSMCEQEPSKEKKEWTVPGDPRVTPVGRFIRKTSIDELPQLWNVLRGEMSLIGPRPERPYFVEKFKEEIPRYMIKHQVRPGITGWAQVNGYRGDTSIHGRIEHDLYYIENWTLLLDIKIAILTVFRGFVNKNAY